MVELGRFTQIGIGHNLLLVGIDVLLNLRASPSSYTKHNTNDNDNLTLITTSPTWSFIPTFKN
jgi:hypothetical protein